MEQSQSCGVTLPSSAFPAKDVTALLKHPLATTRGLAQGLTTSPYLGQRSVLLHCCSKTRLKGNPAPSAGLKMGSASAAPGLGHVERCLAPEGLPQGCQRRFRAPL